MHRKNTVAALIVIALFASCLAESCHPVANPHRLVCFSQGAQLVGSNGGPPHYQSLFELDALEVPSFNSTGEAAVMLVSGQIARLHTGSATCYALPSASLVAPPPAPKQRSPFMEPDAGPTPSLPAPPVHSPPPPAPGPAAPRP